MSKKSNNSQPQPREPEEALEDYYELKTDAVEALVNADTDEVPQYSEEELEKYTSRRPVRIPEALGVCLAKWWFAGAMYYFCGFGLSLSHWVDMILVYSIVLGMVNDLLTHTLIRFFDKQKGDSDRWFMVNKKGVAGLALNILYSFPVILAVWGLYEVVKLVAALLAGRQVTVGAEPFSFGLFVLAVDLAFVGIKNLIVRLVKNSRK